MITESFVQWLVSDMKYRLAMNLDDNKLSLLQSEADLLYNESIDLYEVFLHVITHITYSETDKVFVVEIGSRDLIPGTDIKYDEIVKLIDYGNQSVAGCRVFSDIFYNIKNNLDSYFARYKFGIGGVN